MIGGAGAVVTAANAARIRSGEPGATIDAGLAIGILVFCAIITVVIVAWDMRNRK